MWGFFSFSFLFLFPSQLIHPCQTSLSRLCHFCKKRLHTELPCLSQARLRIDTNYCPLPISLVITALARQCNSLIILNNTNQSCHGVRRGNFPKNSCENVSEAGQRGKSRQTDSGAGREGELFLFLLHKQIQVIMWEKVLWLLVTDILKTLHNV